VSTRDDTSLNYYMPEQNPGCTWRLQTLLFTPLLDRIAFAAQAIPPIPIDFYVVSPSHLCPLQA